MCQRGRCAKFLSFFKEKLVATFWLRRLYTSLTFSLRRWTWKRQCFSRQEILVLSSFPKTYSFHIDFVSFAVCSPCNNFSETTTISVIQFPTIVFSRRLGIWACRATRITTTALANFSLLRSLRQVDDRDPPWNYNEHDDQHEDDDEADEDVHLPRQPSRAGFRLSNWSSIRTIRIGRTSITRSTFGRNKDVWGH